MIKHSIVVIIFRIVKQSFWQYWLLQFLTSLARLATQVYRSSKRLIFFILEAAISESMRCIPVFSFIMDAWRDGHCKAQKKALHQFLERCSL